MLSNILLPLSAARRTAFLTLPINLTGKDNQLIQSHPVTPPHYEEIMTLWHYDLMTFMTWWNYDSRPAHHHHITTLWHHDNHSGPELSAEDVGVEDGSEGGASAGPVCRVRGDDILRGRDISEELQLSVYFTLVVLLFILLLEASRNTFRPSPRSMCRKNVGNKPGIITE